MNTIVRTIGVICIFSVAMAALESAVVVYLRELYYPDGFSVGFKLVDRHILLVELMRELATLVMLAAVGFLAGGNLKERMAFFLLAFAVWDIFYYVWLKVFIDWPASLFEWDILFLIPVTWVGPVLAPVICSLTMILLSFALMANGRRLTAVVWTLLCAGSILILYTFMEDYGGLLIRNGLITSYTGILENKEFIRVAMAYMPADFSWGIFSLGEALLIGAIYVQYQGMAHLRKAAGLAKTRHTVGSETGS